MKTLHTPELVLEPVVVAHAEEMFGILSEPALYQYLDFGPPPNVAHLRGVYAKLEKRHSPDGREGWFNWVVRLKGGAALGVVQATVQAPDTAWIAYVFGSQHWGHGHAHAATLAMLAHLEAEHGSRRFLATVEVDNLRSIALLNRLSFQLASDAQMQGDELTTTERLYVRHRTPAST